MSQLPNTSNAVAVSELEISAGNSRPNRDDLPATEATTSQDLAVTLHVYNGGYDAEFPPGNPLAPLSPLGPVVGTFLGHLPAACFDDLSPDLKCFLEETLTQSADPASPHWAEAPDFLNTSNELFRAANIWQQAVHDITEISPNNSNVKLAPFAYTVQSAHGYMETMQELDMLAGVNTTGAHTHPISRFAMRHLVILAVVEITPAQPI